MLRVGVCGDHRERRGTGEGERERESQEKRWQEGSNTKRSKQQEHPAHLPQRTGQCRSQQGRGWGPLLAFFLPSRLLFLPSIVRFCRGLILMGSKQQKKTQTWKLCLGDARPRRALIGRRAARRGVSKRSLQQGPWTWFQVEQGADCCYVQSRTLGSSLGG